MDSQFEEAHERTEAPPSPVQVARYHRPLLGVPWAIGLLVVPLALTLVGTMGPANLPPRPVTSTAPSVAPQEAAAIAKALFNLRIEGTTWTVSGNIATPAAKASSIDVVKKTAGPGVTVKDALVTKPDAFTPEAKALEALVAAAKLVPGCLIDVKGASVVVHGAAPTEDAKQALLAAITATFPGATTNAHDLLVGDASVPPANCGALADYVRLVTATNKVQFATGGAALTADSQLALKRIATAAKPCPDVKLTVTGNTDSSGKEAENEALSKKRAESVKAQLVTLGMPAESITSTAKGESNPLASNETAAGREINRRVDIVVG